MTDSVSSAGEDVWRNAKRKKTPLRKPDTDRLPPHWPEGERGVLGCVLLEPSTCLDDARLVIREGKEFYDLRHQTIWHALVEMREKGEAIDLITLQQRLKEKGVLAECGDLAYLSELMATTPSAANLPYYLGRVREMFLLRQWISLCTEITGKVFEFEGGDFDALVGGISTDLFKLCESGLRTGEKSMREVMIDVHEGVLEKFRRGVKFSIGPTTGFNYLDNILPGMGPGQLIVEAARPRTGKTAKMMQTAEHVAMVCKCPVAVFSLEMTARSLGARAIFQRAGSDITKFMNGFMSDSDVQKLTVAGTQLAKLPIYIDESPRMAIEDVEIRARRLVRTRGVKILFIDYFQLLYVRNRLRQWSKSDELAECSMRLKGLAKELSVPIYLCAQMNREIEKETHRRPRLSDLRDTGQLEQDADVVMFLWKPDVSSETWEQKVKDILPRVPCPEDWRTGKMWKKNLSIVTCTVEKQREGRSGEDATLVFIKPWTRFVDAYRPFGGTTVSDTGPAEPRANTPELPTNEEMGFKNSTEANED